MIAHAVLRRSLLVLLAMFGLAVSPLALTDASPTISLVSTVVGGGNRATLTTSKTSTTNMNLSAGDLVVITLGFAGSTDTSSAPTDTAGNTYVECCFTEINGVATTIWYAKNTVANSADAITVHFSSATGYIAFVAAQYSGADRSNPLETQAIGSCTSCLSVSSGSFSPAASGNLNVAAMNSSTSAVYAAGNNYTNEATSPGPAPTLGLEDRTNAPVGSQTASIAFIDGGSGDVAISVGSFRAGQGGTAPPAPINLVASPGNAQVTLSWTGSAGATSYNVQRSITSGGPYTTVASPTTTSYTDTALSNGTTYYYVVAAVDSAGTSGNSNQASATPAGGTAPPAPTNLIATAGNVQVGLTWNGSAGATSYNVQRSTTSGGPYTTVANPTTTSYTDTGLSNGTTYFYVVAAVNSIGESGNSNQASATPVGSGVISLVNTVRGGGNRGAAASSETSTTSMNVSGGNLIVAALGFAGYSDNSKAPTDTAGNTYVECCFTETNGVASTIWYAKNTIANSSDAITVHFSSATPYIAFVAAQYSGASTTSPLETQAIGGCASCTSVSSGSFSPAASGNVDVAAMNSAFSSAYVGGPTIQALRRHQDRHRHWLWKIGPTPRPDRRRHR